MASFTDEEARAIEANWDRTIEKIPQTIQVFAIPNEILYGPPPPINSPDRSIYSQQGAYFPLRAVREDSETYEPLMKRLKIESVQATLEVEADAALEAVMVPNGLAPRKSSLHTLPAELQRQIFQSITLKEMIALARTCKELARRMLTPKYLALDPRATFVTRNYEDEGEANSKEIPLCITKYRTNKFSFHNVTNPVVSNIELLMACRYCQGTKAQRPNTPFLSIHWFRHLKMEIVRHGFPKTRGMVELVAMEVMMTCWRISKEKGSHIARRGTENDPARDIAEAQARFKIWIDDCLRGLNVEF